MEDGAKVRFLHELYFELNLSTRVAELLELVSELKF